MNEKDYEKLLNIQTSGDQLGFNRSLHLNRYEPTLYEHLDILLKHYPIHCTDHVIDFGCGKGRLNFYLHHTTKATITGIEMNEEFYEAALQNKIAYLKKNKKSEDKIHFICCYAQDYNIQPQDNKFYFFNPFSVQIFMKVIENILISLETNSREVDLILYYPADDYIYYLESCTAFEFIQEVPLSNHKRDPRERFAIYHLSY
ncbi:MAG: SAM-dependent methyltransferase [Turicibacter sp.]